MRKQKNWFITGASRGFGRIWTEAALKRGDQVAATARDPRDLKELVEQFGSAVLPLQLDVSDRAQVFEKVQEAHEHFGHLDVVLSNAGYGSFGAIEEISMEEIRNVFETNVFGTLSVIQAAVPFLRKQGSGHILTVSSIGGVISFPTGGIYNATKFAVEGFSEALAGEVAAFGVKVTIIEPGSFSTEFRSSVTSAVPMPEYDPIRAAVHGSFKPEMSGDPIATADAILKVVDEEQPPLRLILGSTTLPMIRKVYGDRFKTWEEWEEVANAAQGR